MASPARSTARSPTLAFSLSDWGWVIRTLAHYVRDTNALSLEAAVRRMTLAPALQLGLADRGALLPGMAADVAVFDLARVGTSVAPQQLIARPQGVEHVLVNGTPVDPRRRADARPARRDRPRRHVKRERMMNTTVASRTAASRIRVAVSPALATDSENT